MDFLNTKTIFLHFRFYNMFVNSKGCWLILQKYKNLIYIYYNICIFYNIKIQTLK